MNKTHTRSIITSVRAFFFCKERKKREIKSPLYNNWLGLNSPFYFFLLHPFIIYILIDKVLERLFTRPDGSTFSKDRIKVNISFRSFEDSDIVILV